MRANGLNSLSEGVEEAKAELQGHTAEHGSGCSGGGEQGSSTARVSNFFHREETRGRARGIGGERG